MTLPANWEDGQTFTPEGENAVSAAVNSLMSCTPTSDTTATLSVDSAAYVYNGTAPATWTLPPLADSVNKVFILYNRGTAVVTVNCSGTDKVFAAGVVSTMSLPPSSALIMLNDGTYWLSTAN